jgi:hypothetical protein
MRARIDRRIVHRSKLLGVVSAMPETARSITVRLYKQGLPTAAAAIVTAVLAPFGVWFVAGLTMLVGASAWAGSVRRRSMMVAPERFIGS